MLTYDSPPEMEGQQLMDRGTTASSRVCSRHLSTPSGAPVGKGRAGSLSASTPSLLRAEGGRVGQQGQAGKDKGEWAAGSG